VQSRAKHDRYQERRREAKEKIQKERKKKRSYILHMKRNKSQADVYGFIWRQKETYNAYSQISLRFTDG
jgi:hypothetical protein